MNSIKLFSAYNAWANRQFAECLLNLSKEALKSKHVSSFPTVIGTITHVFDAEFIWMERIKGNPTPQRPKPNDDPHVEIEKNTERSREFAVFIQEQKDDFFEKTIHYQNLSGDKFEQQAWQILMHLYNHGSFHRGQLVSMLRALGQEGKIPRTDLIHYLRLNQ